MDNIVIHKYLLEMMILPYIIPLDVNCDENHIYANLNFSEQEM